MDDTKSSQNLVLEQFIDSLIDQKGFPDLSTEVREEIKQDLLDRIDQFITAKLISALSDEDVQTFEQMLNEGKSESELQQFLQEHLENTTDLVAEALTEFKGVYLGTIATPQ